MSYEFGELQDGTILHSRFIGEINDNLLLNYANALQENKYLEGFGLELVDGREVTAHSTTRQGMEAFTEAVRQVEDQIRGRRVAMVASNDVTFGMFRMWELRREDLDYIVMVFRDYDEALAWLETSRPK